MELVAGVGSVILLVAGIASLLVSRGFSDRVERLQEFSRRVAEGDFRAIAGRWFRRRAGGIWAQSLNQTAARMDRTIRTLTEERNLSAAILGSMVEGVAVVNGDGAARFRQPRFRRTFLNWMCRRNRAARWSKLCGRRN